ncbi:MAG: DUF4214 domain-containing protein [Pseudomonadota bacterium]
MTIQPSLSAADLRREGVIAVESESLQGTLDFSSDEDYFLFLPEPNRTYTIVVDASIDTELGLYETPSLTLIQDLSDDDSGPGLNPEITFETGDTPVSVLIQVDASGAPEPSQSVIEAGLGDYFIEIFDEGPIGPGAAGDVVGDTLATAGGIGVGEALFQSIETPGDEDLYAVYLQAERVYEIAIEARAGALQGPADPFLQVFAPGGRLLEENDDAEPGTLDAVVRLTPEVSGFHLISATDSDLAQGTGGYVVSVEDRGSSLEPGQDRVGDTRSTAPTAEVGQTITGSADFFDDTDLYAFALTEDNTYRIDARGLDGFDPLIVVAGPDGLELFQNDDGGEGRDAQLGFTPASTDFYFIAVESGDGRPGVFELELTLTDSAAATQADVQLIALLYEAGLGRQAEFSGLNFWVEAFEDGLGLRGLSTAFLVSQEFEETIGNPDFLSDFDLVTQLYANVLERPPEEVDEAGRQFWLGQLSRPNFDEVDLLIAFAASQENRQTSPEVLDLIPLSDGWDFVSVA